MIVVLCHGKRRIYTQISFTFYCVPKETVIYYKSSMLSRLAWRNLD